MDDAGTIKAAEQLLTDWLERTLRGRVTRLEREGRWRPAWRAQVTTDAGARDLYVRGERIEQFLPYGLRREYEIHRLLEAGGVRVPHLHGFIEAIPATVMDKVAGRSNLGSAVDETERQAIRAQLVEQMAKMHALDVAPFVEAGLRAPQTPREITLSFFHDVWGNYRARKARPDPALEFAAAWVLRRAPDAANPLSYVACDAGQFIFEDGRLTAMMDFELSILGDPMMDLAALRIRDQWEKLGDLPSLYRMYGEATGRTIDLQAIRFHTVSFALGGALSSVLCMDQFLSQPAADADYVEYLCWIVWELKQALEAIAEHDGVTLPVYAPPAPARSLVQEPLFALRASVQQAPAPDAVEAYRKDARLAVLGFLDRIAAYGAAVEAEYLDDAAQVLGARPVDTRDADARLEAYVAKADPAEDERLLRLFHAQVSRQAFLLAAPDNRYLAGLVNPLIPIA